MAAAFSYSVDTNQAFTIAVIGLSGKTFLADTIATHHVDPRQRSKWDLLPSSITKFCQTSLVDRRSGHSRDWDVTCIVTPKCSFNLIDAPGCSRDFEGNFGKAVCLADAVVLCVPATVCNATTASAAIDDFSRDTLASQALTAYTHGITSLMVAVTFMDSIQWDVSQFTTLTKLITEVVHHAGFRGQIDVIPTAVSRPLNNHCNVVHQANMSSLAPWYKGPSLLGAIEAWQVTRRVSGPASAPLLVSLARSYKIGGVGTVAIGRVLQGTLKPNARIALTAAALPCDPYPYKTKRTVDFVLKKYLALKERTETKSTSETSRRFYNRKMAAFMRTHRKTLDTLQSLLPESAEKRPAALVHSPEQQHYDVPSLEWNYTAQQSALPGSLIAMRIKNAFPRELHSGILVSSPVPRQIPVSVQSVAARVVMLAPKLTSRACTGLRGIRIGFRGTLICSSMDIPVTVRSIGPLLERDWKTEHSSTPAQMLCRGQRAVVVLTMAQPMVLLPFSVCHDLGRFSVHSQGQLVLAGCVLTTKSFLPFCWSPERHRMFPIEFRRIAKTVLCMALRNRDTDEPHYPQTHWWMLPDELIELAICMVAQQMYN